MAKRPSARRFELGSRGQLATSELALEDLDVPRLVASPEGKTLEFKARLVGTEPVLRSAVAFANTAGGLVVFGVEDGTRRIVGVPNPVELEARLANVLSDGIRPRLAPEIVAVPWRRTHLVVVRVHAGTSRPYYLAAAGATEGVYVRVGSSNRRADRPMVEELRRLARSESFDEQPVVDSNSEAIDFRAASELFAPQRQLARGDLETLGLAVRHQGHLRPTVGGILLFGTDRERLFPDAYVHAGRFRGTSRSEIADSVELHGPLPSLIDQALEFVRKHEARGLEIRGARHQERWSVPQIAAREAIVNAVVHADYAQRGAPIRLSIYDDRIEIENPGLLPFGLTIDDMLRGVSRLRNRVIGRVFKELRLIEQWGSGVGRMVEACRRAGLPDPLFEEIGWQFRVTLGKTLIAGQETDPIDRAILDLLGRRAGRTTAEIAASIKRSARATRTRLGRLAATGQVVEVGTGPQDPRRGYYLTQRAPGGRQP